MQVLLCARQLFAAAFFTLNQALHMSRTKTRNSSVHETITAYRLWYRCMPATASAVSGLTLCRRCRCDSSDSETGANLKVGLRATELAAMPVLLLSSSFEERSI